MKLPDTNVWLARILSKHSHHAAALSWWEEQDETETLAFCQATQQSVLRLLTTSELMKLYGIDPLTNQKAWSVYQSLGADDRVGLISEPAGVEAVWQKLAARRTSSPKLWMDAYLAAFAISSNATLVTTDRAFSQFAGLRVEWIK